MIGPGAPMRRFWRAAAVEPAAGGYGIALDGRALRTPAKARCVMPARALAEAVAAEWEAVGEAVDPAAMPMTRAANSAIDRVAPNASAVRGDLAGYGGTDLICYRAPHPDPLAARQAEAWDPLIAWAGDVLGARLVAVEGVMHRPQPEPALAALKAELDRLDVWELTAMHDLVTLSGSLVIALAVSRARLAAEDAWTVSRIDEDWQAAEWGEDAEAVAAAAAHRAGFRDAARMLGLVRGG